MKYCTVKTRSSDCIQFIQCFEFQILHFKLCHLKSQILYYFFTKSDRKTFIKQYNDLYLSGQSTDQNIPAIN